MPRAPFVAGCLPLILGVWCARSGAASVPVHSEVGLRATVEFYCANVADTDSKLQSQEDPLAPLAVAVSTTLAYGGAWATARGHVESSWVNVSSGAVHIEAGYDKNGNMGACEDVAIFVRGACVPETYRHGTPDWVYTFIPDADGVFHLSYSSSVVGLPDYWSSFYLLFRQVAPNKWDEQIVTIAAAAQGSVSFAFSQGDTCTVRLINTAMNYSGAGGERHCWQSVSCSWNFQTATVPVGSTTWGAVKSLYRGN